MKERIINVILVLGFIATLSYVIPEACNPEGSIAAQINFGGNSVCK